MDVEHALQHLLEVVLADALFKGTRIGHIVVKLPAWDQLLCDVSNLDSVTIFLVPNRAFLEFKVFDYMLVLKLICRRNFLFQKLESLVIEASVV